MKRESAVKTTTTTTMMTKTGSEVHQKKAQKNRSRTVSKKQSRIRKAELLTLTEHLQRNPTNEKGKGRPLPALNYS